MSNYLNDLVSRSRWEDEVAFFKRQLSRFNSSITNQRQEQSIKADLEYRFILCRHWNIHDSMLHSRYIASKLQLWRDRGWRRLTELFAAMGVPLEACRRDWIVMEKQHREHFDTRLSIYSKRFGLDEVVFPSFLIEDSTCGGMAAGDHAFALFAILENPYNDLAASRSEALRANFSVALRALQIQKGAAEVKEGIRLAIHQHQVLFGLLQHIFTHRILRYGKRFRYAVLRGASGTNDKAWITHPQTLSRLALFVKDATGQGHSKKAHLPLLLASWQPDNLSFLVVAVAGSHSTQAQGVKPFNMAYRAAAEKSRARIRHDSFEATVIEVADDDLKPFIQSLQKEL